MRNAYFIAGEISAVVGNHAGHEAGAGGGGLNAAMDDVAFASVEKLANGMEWQFGASFVTVCSSLESWVWMDAVSDCPRCSDCFLETGPGTRAFGLRAD